MTGLKSYRNKQNQEFLSFIQVYCIKSEMKEPIGIQSVQAHYCIKSMSHTIIQSAQTHTAHLSLMVSEDFVYEPIGSTEKSFYVCVCI